jgi:REP element-mobilizing transposase RayT
MNANIRLKRVGRSAALRHHRKSIRLKGWDYSRPGAYFVTLCVQDRECLFGKIISGRMVLNAAGKMVEKWHLELANKFTTIKIDEYVVMPNHFHSIIIIVPPHTVGADPCVCTMKSLESQHMGEHTGSPRRETRDNNNLSSIMQWFKTMTTNEYIRNVKANGWPPFAGKLWQRNFYDHIGRDGNELLRIRQYIRNNPQNWGADDEKPFSKSPRYVAMLNPQRQCL